MWQSSQQAFVTYSTAEAELVSYCEALNAGRSESMICAMTAEPVGQNSMERLIYGDNMAAIAMAQGTANSSWRTRHLRVWSSFLKEALDGTAPGGLWKLLRLRGVELLADGITKPLMGQAFFKFVQDLGMQRHQLPEPDTEPRAEGGAWGTRSSGYESMENEETNWVSTLHHRGYLDGAWSSLPWTTSF